jgi:hypothetical protein
MVIIALLQKMMKIFLIAFLLPLGLSLKCDISGECTQSHLVDQLLTNDKNSCIEECRDNSRANWYTFQRINSVCLLYENCILIDDEFCNDCVTGEAECPTSQCNLEGICDVSHGQDCQVDIFKKYIFKKFEKFKSVFRKISKKFPLCPKSIKNGQIITDLAKTVHFGKYYFNKLQ